MMACVRYMTLKRMNFSEFKWLYLHGFRFRKKVEVGCLMYNHDFSWLDMSLSGLESSKISEAKSGKKLWKKTRKVLLKTVESNKKRMLDCEWTVILQIVISSGMRVFKSTVFLSSLPVRFFNSLKVLTNFQVIFHFF